MLDQRIGPTTQRFAVLGESLAHTWSPYIHNSLFAAGGLDAVYLPITVPHDRLDAAVAVLSSCFSGFNVTIPYKERIIPLLDDVDDAVKACGAVNTVSVNQGRMTGHITDGLGMLHAIEECGISTQQTDVLILGGGGAARVAGYEFLMRGGCVTFAVRDVAKGRTLVQELAQTQADGAARIAVCALSGIPEGAHDLLVNCTPVGMYPHVKECPVSPEIVARCGAVFDAVYNPRMTCLIEMAKTKGIATVGGLGMLFYQAVEAQRFWFGRCPACAQMQSTIYAELLEQL